MKICKIIAVLLMLSASIACERSIEFDIDVKDEGKLVVQALLTDELMHQEIYLSETFAQLNDVPPPISEANVKVEVANVTYDFIPDQTGAYRSEIPFAVNGQLNYRLEVEWKNDVYQGESELSAVAPIPEINLSQRADSFLIDNNIIPLFSSTQQAMYQFDVDWSHIHPTGVNKARLIYYTFSDVHIGQFARPPREEVLFPSGSIVVVTKYGLSEQFADYLRSIAIETDWNGSLFYGYPQNQIGNISPEALGFFASCAVLRDTIIAQ